jgi:hypothetical protein
MDNSYNYDPYKSLLSVRTPTLAVTAGVVEWLTARGWSRAHHMTHSGNFSFVAAS